MQTDARADELERARAEMLRLELEVARLEAEQRAMSARYVEVERAHSELVRLYIAHRRVGDAAEGDQTLSAIGDILSAVIGCEAFGIYACDAAGREGRLVTSLGIDSQRWSTLPLLQGEVRMAMASGRSWYVASPARSAHGVGTPIAYVPLKARGVVLGIAVIFELLSQKEEWDSSDAGLFQMLEAEGGKAFVAQPAGGGPAYGAVE